ncbi:hypothetical protein IF1G_09409 [Cordyceps javanica]|uniref:Uncharacterized protein n=1 Tax=Cordyceps javanica TaxID=43265 RepID=A0A545UQT9_9HYPO|nr:hypothetical protein IF1G_09409 [Cordyceps javanica]
MSAAPSTKYRLLPPSLIIPARPCRCLAGYGVLSTDHVQPNSCLATTRPIHVYHSKNQTMCSLRVFFFFSTEYRFPQSVASFLKQQASAKWSGKQRLNCLTSSRAAHTTIPACLLAG